MLGDSSLLTGSTSRLMDTFRENNIKCSVVNDRLNLVRYQTSNGDWRLLRGLVSEKLPLFSKQICDNKLWTYSFFSEHGLPTPETIEVTSEDLWQNFISRHDAVVVKPRSGAHGHGVSTNIKSEDDATAAIDLARTFNNNVLVQQQINGTDTRILVIGGRIISALERRPAHVIGDGTHTIKELIEIENLKPQRGRLGIDTLVEISMQAAEQYLTPEQLSSVPKKGESARVVGPSNQSIGGTVHDITEVMPSSMRKDIEMIATTLLLPVAGVDCIITDSGYYFLEINASPGIAIHDDPVLGIESGCFKAYMKLLHEDKWWRSLN